MRHRNRPRRDYRESYKSIANMYSKRIGRQKVKLPEAEASEVKTGMKNQYIESYRQQIQWAEEGLAKVLPRLEEKTSDKIKAIAEALTREKSEWQRFTLGEQKVNDYYGNEVQK